MPFGLILFFSLIKVAEFDADGRPLHFLFYTRNHEYYQIIYVGFSNKFLFNSFIESFFVFANSKGLNSENYQSKQVRRCNQCVETTKP